MEVDQIRALRERLEEDLRALLWKFERMSGVSVSGLGLKKINVSSMSRHADNIIEVRVIVEL